MNSGITVKKIAWLAGILEGEGSFSFNDGGFTISLSMTDEDVVAKVASLWNRPYHLSSKGVKHGYKVQYRVNICATPAIEWMFTIYSFMGYRRQSQMLHVINKWKAVPAKDRVNFPCGHPRSHENTISRRRTTECRSCANERSRQQWLKRKADANG